jgi:hypothetical protein
MKASYRIAVEADIDVVAQDMREADKDEVEASGGFSPLEALLVSYRASEPCYAATLDDRAVALFGVSPADADVGVIWMLGTNDITDHPVTFMRWSRTVVPMLIRPYKMVCNIVDKRNTAHVEWIRRTGFSFIREIIHGPQNITFYEFARLNDV